MITSSPLLFLKVARDLVGVGGQRAPDQTSYKVWVNLLEKIIVGQSILPLLPEVCNIHIRQILSSDYRNNITWAQGPRYQHFSKHHRCSPNRPLLWGPSRLSSVLRKTHWGMDAHGTPSTPGQINCVSCAHPGSAVSDPSFVYVSCTCDCGLLKCDINRPNSEQKEKWFLRKLRQVLGKLL